MRREVGIVLVVIYPLSLSGTRGYWRPSEPFVVLVLLDVEELCSSADDRLDDDVRESVEASRGCTITLCWV
jgi:hypothetical protein